jgi:hypothetical protein
MVKTQKNKAKLQQISDTAWILQQGPRKVGILNKDVQDKFFYINGKTIEYFTNEQEVAKKFGNAKIFEEQITTSPVVNDTFYIKGHPIDYETPFPIDTSHPEYNDDVPLYTKTPESDIFYAAGWYAINFEKGWKHGHGPKYSTLTQYGYKGPFKTEIECRQVLRQLNKKKKED